MLLDLEPKPVEGQAQTTVTLTNNDTTPEDRSPHIATLLSASPAGPDEWENPLPIKSELSPVPPLPVDLLPKGLAQWIEDLANRMCIPIDCAAVGALVVAGSLIGTACGIRPKQHDDWLVVPNLWGVMVLPPGRLKSPVLKAVAAPISTLETAAAIDHESKIKSHKVDCMEFEARQKALQNDLTRAAQAEAKPADGKGVDMSSVKQKLLDLAEPATPIQKRYLTNNTTMEKLHELLSTNERGMLIVRDELSGLLASLCREDKAEERAFYLEGANGTGRFTFDRIGRGTISVDNLCLSVFGGIQPDRLKRHLVSAIHSGNNDGLIQRFQLMVYPDDISWQYVDRVPNFLAQEKARDVFVALANAQFASLGAKVQHDRIPYLNFDQAAQELFKQWLTDLEQRLHKDDHPILIEHLSKYRSLMPSIALIDYLVNAVGGDVTGAVSLESAERAAGWCDYLEQHSRRIYGLVTDARARSAKSLATNIGKQKMNDGFTARDVYRKGWTDLTTTEETQSALDELVEHHWLHEYVDEKKTVRYLINPLVFQR